jgi:hypothetical protein
MISDFGPDSYRDEISDFGRQWAESEEPSQTLIFSGSSITPAPGGAKNRVQICWRARRSQNQFTPLGAGVNKLIFKRF